uniref:NADH-ubiquinone oxidoreductase chain 4L n=1 Tax=Histeroidea sp. 3 KM-2017 TaxID=2219436 RepID=A0A346RIF0_9COLE|nr:NADH dehydrogenase subunit 4L [Histeroidea sp. 3 KM-2017]
MWKLMYFIGLVSFCLNRKHFLLMLLSLEFILLSLYYGYMISYMMFGYNLYFALIILAAGVCEGVLGLAILVSMMRSYGSDMFNSFNMW